MSHSPDGDDAYLTVLRSTLPSVEDKARARKRLAALGVGSAALIPGASSQAQATSATWKLSTLGKTVAALSGVVALGGALYFAFDPGARPSSPVAPRTVQPPSTAVEAEKGTHIVPPPVTPAREVTPKAAGAGTSHEPQGKAQKVRSRQKASPLDTLEGENALLGAAVRALHEGRTTQAAHLLDEHERRYPDGVLRDERKRARARLTEAKLKESR
jgi:hypothetical protein